MKIVVVYSHPVAESFGAAVRDTLVATLRESGHNVRLLDLYEMKFDPVMQAGERRTYNDGAPTDPALAEHIDALRWAEGLIFVYPTWWYSMPAMLKGWFDRVFGVDVAFKLDPGGGTIVPLLGHIKLIGVATTCGASMLVSHLMGHPGRRIVLRGIRAICSIRARTIFTAHYNMDKSTPRSRAAYLARVRRRFAKI